MNHLIELKRTALIIFFVLVIVACGGMAAEETAMPASIESESFGETGAEPAPIADGTTANSVAAQQVERVIIRSGFLSLVVSDAAAVAENIETLTNSTGGWVVSSELSISNSVLGTKRGNVSIRVPSDQFEQTMSDVKKFSNEVRNESTSGQDVTDEYVDLNSRLSNLQATEERLLAFLEDAANVEEALAVNQQLTQLSGDIEVIQGRLKFINESAAFSSIQITLIPDSDAQPIQIGRWSPTGTAKDALEFLVNGLQWLANLAIWFVIVGIPLLIILRLVLGFFRRFVRPLWSGRLPRLRRRKATESAENQSD